MFLELLLLLYFVLLEQQKTKQHQKVQQTDADSGQSVRDSGHSGDTLERREARLPGRADSERDVARRSLSLARQARRLAEHDWARGQGGQDGAQDARGAVGDEEPRRVVALAPLAHLCRALERDMHGGAAAARAHQGSLLAQVLRGSEASAG